MMMKPRLIRGIPLSMDMSRLPRGNIWDQTNVCVDSIPFRTHTLLLFLTPWVHISMVTSMFVYLFPDFFFFPYNWSPTRAARLGIGLFVADIKCTCPYARAKSGTKVHPAFLDSGQLLLFHTPPLRACPVGPFKAGIRQRHGI